MIRIASCPNKSFGLSKKKLDSSVNKLQHRNIDIICFQKTSSPRTDNLALVEKLSASLGMTYTFSNITHHQENTLTNNEKQRKTTLAILNGKNTWMLNSGSFPLTEDPKEKRHVQFGLIRHGGNSIFIINALFSSIEKQAHKQLTMLLALQILKEQYGAVVINSNIHKILSSRVIKKAFERESFKQHSIINDTNNIVLLSAKDNPPATLTLYHPETADFSQFDLDRSTQHIRKKRYSRLSFRERWLGSRDADRAFAC